MPRLSNGEIKIKVVDEKVSITIEGYVSPRTFKVLPRHLYRAYKKACKEIILNPKEEKPDVNAIEPAGEPAGTTGENPGGDQKSPSTGAGGAPAGGVGTPK